MGKTSQITTFSPEQTHALGRRLSAILASGDVVCLYGDLGTGKTCLVQGMAEGLGAEDRAVSPSFTLVNEYPGRLPLYHFDCYRLKSAAELDMIGFDEYLGMEGVAVIEWAERIAERLPDERLDVRLERLSDKERKLSFEPRGTRWESLLKGTDLLSVSALADDAAAPPPGEGVRG